MVALETVVASLRKIMSNFATKQTVSAVARMAARSVSRRSTNSRVSYTTQGITVKPTAKASTNSNKNSIVPRWG